MLKDALKTERPTNAAQILELVADAGRLRISQIYAAVHYFATSEAAADAAATLVRAGDLVLVKGSRGVKTDRTTERRDVAFKSDKGPFPASIFPTDSALQGKPGWPQQTLLFEIVGIDVAIVGRQSSVPP